MPVAIFYLIGSALGVGSIYWGSTELVDIAHQLVKLVQ